VVSTTKKRFAKSGGVGGSVRQATKEGKGGFGRDGQGEQQVLGDATVELSGELTRGRAGGKNEANLIITGKKGKGG